MCHASSSCLNVDLAKDSVTKCFVLVVNIFWALLKRRYSSLSQQYVYASVNNDGWYYLYLVLAFADLTWNNQNYFYLINFF